MLHFYRRSFIPLIRNPKILQISCKFLFFKQFSFFFSFMTQREKRKGIGPDPDKKDLIEEKKINTWQDDLLLCIV